MVAQNVFQRASSHQIRYLECFADRYNIPRSPTTNFHPDLIATILQTTFFYSAHCSISNTISLRSVWCRRAMIPGEIFTGFAEFQRIVSINDFRIPVGLHELLQASLGFLWSFCFALIRLDPLGSQVLHHDCTSEIVSRFTTFTENVVICCNQITKIFQHEVRLRHCVFCMGPL